MNFNKDELKFAAKPVAKGKVPTLSDPSLQNMIGALEWSLRRKENYEIAFCSSHIAMTIKDNKAKILSQLANALVIKTKNDIIITAYFVGSIGQSFALPKFAIDGFTSSSEEETPVVKTTSRRLFNKPTLNERKRKPEEAISSPESPSPAKKKPATKKPAAKKPPAARKPVPSRRSVLLSISSESSFEDALGQGCTQKMF